MPKQPIADRREMEAILNEVEVGCLATVGPDGQPYVTPVNCVYHEGKIVFHCAPQGRKLDNISAEPRVCFEAHEMMEIVHGDKGCGCSTRYRSVLAFGRARILTDLDEKRAALVTLTARYARGRPFDPPTDERVARTGVVEIVVEDMTGKRNGEAT